MRGKYNIMFCKYKKENETDEVIWQSHLLCRLLKRFHPDVKLTLSFQSYEKNVFNFQTEFKATLPENAETIQRLEVNHGQGQIPVLWVIWYVIFNNVRRSSLSCCRSLSHSPSLWHTHKSINTLTQLKTTHVVCSTSCLCKSASAKRQLNNIKLKKC